MASANTSGDTTTNVRGTGDPRDNEGDSGQRKIVKPGSRWTKEREFVLTGQFGSHTGQRFYRCREIPSGEQFLLKRVRVDGSSGETARWRRDVTSWSQLRSPHILAYRDAWESRDFQHVLCDPALMPLSELLDSMRPERPCEHLFSVWLFHILSALQYMHERHEEQRPMLYRNVHPDCIVVTDQCCLQLCHFADTKQLDHPRGTTETVVGQGLFQSPEIQQGLPYDKSADVWSAGVVSVFIADYSRASKVGSARKLRQTLAASGLRQELQSVVLKALQQDPAQRPGASSIISQLAEVVGTERLEAPIPASLFPSPLRKPIDSRVVDSKDTEDESLLAYNEGAGMFSAYAEPVHKLERQTPQHRGTQERRQQFTSKGFEIFRYMAGRPATHQDTDQPTRVPESTGSTEHSSSNPAVEDLSPEEDSSAGGSRTTDNRKTSRKLVIAAVAIKKNKGAGDRPARNREQRFAAASEARTRSPERVRVINPDVLSRISEIINLSDCDARSCVCCAVGRKEGERGGGPWVRERTKSTKARQDTELTSGLGDSLPQLDDTDVMLLAGESLHSQQTSSPSPSTKARAQGRVHSFSSTQSSSVSRTSSSSSSVSMELRIPPETQGPSPDSAEDPGQRDDTSADTPPQHWLHKDRTSVKDNLLSTFITTSGTQTDREDKTTPPLPPLFVRRWQVRASFSSAGRTWQLPNSDVSLVIPRRAIDTDVLMTVHGAVCANVEYISKVLALSPDEIMISPLAEFSAHEEVFFKRPVEIRLPHALPRNADMKGVRVYQIVRDSTGDKTISRLPHKPSNLTSQEDMGYSGSRSQSDRAPQIWSKDGSFQLSEDGQVMILTTHFSGYVCTYCGQFNTGPVVLQVLATGNHRLKDPLRHSANVHVHVWDDRLLITDFREQYCMSRRNFKELDRTSLTLIDGIRGSHLSLSLTIIGDEEVKYWHHCRASDGSPGLQEERVYSVDEVLGCDHVPCAAGGSRLRPLEAKWKLESLSPSPPHLWFQCVVDIRHLLPPDSQATPADPQAMPPFRCNANRSLSVEMEAARDPLPGMKEGRGGNHHLQRRVLQDSAHLSQLHQHPSPPHVRDADNKNGAGGAERHTHGARGPREAWHHHHQLGDQTQSSTEPDDSLLNLSSQCKMVVHHQPPQRVLPDHPDNIPLQDPSWASDLHPIEAVQHDELARQHGSPREHDERSKPSGSQEEQGHSLLSGGSMLRQLNHLRSNMRSSSSVSSPGAEAGVPARVYSGREQVHCGRTHTRPRTTQANPGLVRSTGPGGAGSSTPQERSATPNRVSNTPQSRSAIPNRVCNNPQGRSATPNSVSNIPQGRSATSNSVSTTPQGRSGIPRSISNASQGRPSTPNNASNTPHARGIPQRKHAVQHSATSHNNTPNNSRPRSTTPYGITPTSQPHSNIGHGVSNCQQVSQSVEPNRSPGAPQVDMPALASQLAQMAQHPQDGEQLRQLCHMILGAIPSTPQDGSNPDLQQAARQLLDSDSSDDFLSVANPSVEDRPL